MKELKKELDLLTTAEAAKYVGYNYEVFCRKVRSGEIKAFKPKGRKLFKKEDLINYIKN